ncbi:nuclear transport factor 2 family protein [Rhodoferax sp.]|uniref:YybH family protein n=1 Tax=Rhodoferax sp. TaxID=50421 RepID=UPI002606A790|nr:nuclear transport factor 2 family protein [Rhodoferax sp.]MDD2924615.1 nuclear transport factor 2 family protein [Rhodoferax sp.]
MDDIETSMLRVMEAYKTAISEKDIEAFISLYSPDVKVFDAWSVWFYDGSEIWRKLIKEWFLSLGNECVRVNFEEVQTLCGCELAVLTAIVTYAGYSAEGKELRTMQNRLTWTFKPERGAVKIVHEHTSVPVDFNDKKAILLRELR